MNVLVMQWCDASSNYAKDDGDGGDNVYGDDKGDNDDGDDSDDNDYGDDNGDNGLSGTG